MMTAMLTRVFNYSVWVLGAFAVTGLPGCAAVPFAQTQDMANNPTVTLSDTWTCFGTYPDHTEVPSEQALQAIPDQLSLAGVQRQAQQVTVVSSRLDLVEVFASMELREIAYVYLTVTAEEAGVYEFGFAADWWLMLWCNGKLVHDNTTNGAGNAGLIFRMDDQVLELALNAGENLLVARVRKGQSSALLTLGGPAELEIHRAERQKKYPLPPETYFPGDARSIEEVKGASKVTIEKYEVFCDLQDQDFPLFFGGFLRQHDGLTPIRGEDGCLEMAFSKSLNFHYVEDLALGVHGFMVRTCDDGQTWSEPERQDSRGLVKDEKIESFNLWPFIRTRNGTDLWVMNHQHTDTPPTGDATHGFQVEMNDLQHDSFIGRREKSQTEFRFDTNLQDFADFFFVEGGFQFPSGRILLTGWGGNHHENWIAAALISDDDGVTWRKSIVGYEPDISIRDNPNVTAGFNEMTMFLDPDGTVVAIMRGREGLGRGVPGTPFGRDTWYLRSESRDQGETWSKPVITNLAGTGSPARSLVLPDGSYLLPTRVPYSRDYYDLPDKELYGLHLARSFDKGKTWATERIIQHDPEHIPMRKHWTAMNGIFLKVDESTYDYIFGFSEPSTGPEDQVASGQERLLRIRFKIEP